MLSRHATPMDSIFFERVSESFYDAASLLTVIYAYSKRASFVLNTVSTAFYKVRSGDA